MTWNWFLTLFFDMKNTQDNRVGEGRDTAVAQENKTQAEPTFLTVCTLAV